MISKMLKLQLLTVIIMSLFYDLLFREYCFGVFRKEHLKLGLAIHTTDAPGTLLLKKELPQMYK